MRTLATYDLYLRRAMSALIGICGVCVFLYGALLLMAVSHAAHLSSANKQIETLTRQLSQAESQYLDKTESLDLSVAKSMGLVKPSAVSIVYAPTPSSLSFNR